MGSVRGSALRVASALLAEAEELDAGCVFPGHALHHRPKLFLEVVEDPRRRRPCPNGETIAGRAKGKLDAVYDGIVGGLGADSKQERVLPHGGRVGTLLDRQPKLSAADVRCILPHGPYALAHEKVVAIRGNGVDRLHLVVQTRLLFSGCRNFLVYRQR